MKWREIPWRLAAAAVLLSMIGLMAIWVLWPPQPSKSGILGSTFIRQTIFLAGSIVMMVAVAIPRPTQVRRSAYLLYGAGLVVLIILLKFVDPMRGTRGWIAVGPFTLQPAEFMKIAAILALARFLSYGRYREGFRGFALACALAAAPAVLVLMQPDLGTAMLFVPVLFAMLLANGSSRRWIGAAAILLVLSLPVAFFTVMKPYQKARVVAFVRPSAVDKDQNYQMLHAVSATASGGFLGGMSGSSASYPFYIPDRHTDFIFSVIGEELGFVGCSLVLMLYGVILYEMFRIGWTTKEPFGRLVVVGMAAFLFAQVMINIGMTVGMAPTTGLTLPFVSYGGSSLVTCFVAVGLAINIGRHKVHTLRKGS